MPRRKIAPHKARAELLAIKLEKARYEIRAVRRAELEREAACAVRRTTPDWVDMDKQIKALELEAELDAMEAVIDERRVKIPILNHNLKPVHYHVANEPVMTGKYSDPREPHEIAYNKIKRPPPPNGKNWKHPATLEGRHPADDWRNWE